MEVGSSNQQKCLADNSLACTQTSAVKSPTAEQLEVTTVNNTLQVDECIAGEQLSNHKKNISNTTSSICHDLYKDETQNSCLNTVSNTLQVDECIAGEQLSNHKKDISNTTSSICHDLYKDETQNSCLNRSGCARNNGSSTAVSKSYSLRSSDDKLHRSKSDESSKTPRHAMALSAQQGAARRRGRKKKHESSTSVDPIARVKNRVKFLLSRLHYEHILIEAYAGEGWNRKSQEKVKPDKEIQRAVSDILKWKLKIRESFKELESLCSDGKHQESLFDSEGQIYSEDIFCAKCGSKEVSADNDIILCDGVCDRGFHQMCLEPPLLKEQIPPDDQSWLCPGCSCKLELITLLNDDQGTKLCIEDKWEKIFPEAAAHGGKIHQLDDLGLPSDDSEDTDYDPDLPDPEKDMERSSSDESDFTSDSSGSSCHRGSLKYQASDSYASEDVAPGPACSKSPKGEKLVANESEISTPATGRRHVERLDYKKLYDEAYGDVSSDSSDDNDYLDTCTSESGEFNASEKITIAADNAKIQSIGSSANSESNINAYNSAKVQATGNEHEIKIPQRKPRKKCMVSYKYALGDVASPATLKNPKRACEQLEVFGDQGSDLNTPKRIREPLEVDGDRGSDLYTPRPRKFTLEAYSRLCDSLRESQYPTRQTKEKLASELGMEIKQIEKWFERARRCIRGADHAKSGSGGVAPSNHPENTGGLSILAGGYEENRTQSTDLMQIHKEECSNNDEMDAEVGYCDQ